MGGGSAFEQRFQRRRNNTLLYAAEKGPGRGIRGRSFADVREPSVTHGGEVQLAPGARCRHTELGEGGSARGPLAGGCSRHRTRVYLGVRALPPATSSRRGVIFRRHEADRPEPTAPEPTAVHSGPGTQGGTAGPRHSPAAPRGVASRRRVLQGCCGAGVERAWGWPPPPCRRRSARCSARRLARCCQPNTRNTGR